MLDSPRLLYYGRMQPDLDRRIEEVWSMLRASEERIARAERSFTIRMEKAERRMDKAERRMEKFDKRMQLAEQRMDRAEQRMDRSEERMDRAEERMEKFDKRLEATRKLVELGMKLMVRLETRLDHLSKEQQAFLRAFRNGRDGKNGHGHSGPSRRH